MYFWPGVVAIWSALFFGLASLVTYVRVDRGRTDLLGTARSAYAAFTTSIVAASGVLLALLLQHRFDVSYVNSYSSLDLPFHFLLSTFWAGQEGSFLLWIFWGSIIGLFVWRSAKEQEAPVMVVYLATFLGIVAILCKQSPFKLLPPPAPTDGVGLNPLLQDAWMVIHPPVMFIGFASLSVPFAFAIAALWKKRWDGWVTRAIPWALVSFVTLGTAILMGGYWAYKTLGWGGYWGWDPVENTSLVPWLFTVALVHGMFLQRVRRRHRKVNLILACASFATILYGTFLTRSGVLADFSVHSFIDLGITGWLVAILGFFVLLSVALIARALEEDSGSRGGGNGSPDPKRPLHPRDRRLLRARVRDPPRNLGSPPHPALGHSLAGRDLVLRKDRGAGGFPAARALGPGAIRFLEERARSPSSCGTRGVRSRWASRSSFSRSPSAPGSRRASSCSSRPVSPPT